MEGFIPVNVSLTEGLNTLSDDTLIEVMASMSSPTNLLNFLLAFPLTRPLFRNYHRQILSQVLDAEAPDSIIVQQARNRPLSYGAAVLLLERQGPSVPPLLDVPELMNPTGTLVAVVLAMANIRGVDRRRYRKLTAELNDRGFDRYLPQMLRAHWTTRCTLKQARAVVSSCPSISHSFRRDCPLLAFWKTKRLFTALLEYLLFASSKDQLADRCIAGRKLSTTHNDNGT